MYDNIKECYGCLDYEYDDPSLKNNCIHYRFCLEKLRKEKNNGKYNRKRKRCSRAID